MDERRSCSKCLFSDCCDGNRICEHYTDGDLNDMDIDRISREIRKEIESDWYAYIRDYQ